MEVFITTTTKESVHRSIAILELPKPIGALIAYAQGIVTRLTGSPAFGSPNPPLAVLTTAIGDL